MPIPRNQFYLRTSMPVFAGIGLALAFALSLSSCGESSPTIDHIWSNPEEVLVLRGHTQEIYRAIYSPDGSVILTMSADSTARLWDGESGNELAVLTGHAGVVRAAVFLPEGNQVRTYGEDMQVKTWNIQTGIELSSVRVEYAEKRLVGVEFSPDGSLLVLGGTGQAMAYLAKSGDLRYPLAPMGHPGLRVNTMDVCFRKDGGRIATAAYSQEIGIWDAGDGTSIFNLHEHGQGALAVAYSPEMSLIASGSRDQTVIIWDAQLGRVVKKLQPGWEVRSVAFSPDGSALLAVESVPRGELSQMSIWDVQTGQRVVILDQAGPVRNGSFHPQGHRLVSPSGKVARVYQAGTADKPIMLATPQLPSDVDSLIQVVLTDSNSQARIRATWLLAELPRQNDQIVAALGEYLSSPDPTIRLNATLVFAELGPQASRTVPILSRLLQSDQVAEIRTATVIALGCIAADRGDSLAVSALITALRDEDTGVRYHAAHALRNIGVSATGRAVPELVELVLTEEAFGIRRMIAFDLGNAGDVVLNGLPRLIEGISAKNERERWWACYTVWSMAAGLGSKVQSAIPAVKRAMTDPSDFRDLNGGPPRKYAIHAMGAIGPIVLDVDPHIIVLLANIMEDDDDYYHRKAAALALQNILGVKGLRQQVRGYKRRTTQ